MAVRPVDAEKYMELLKEQYLHHEAMGNKQVAKAWQGAMQLLYDMPTLTPSNEWVSVEERLPEDDTSEYKAQIAVLVLTDRESIKIKKRTYHPGRVYYGKFYPERWDWGTFNDDHITHWMPLPEPPDRRPPEGEEEEKP